MCFMCHVSCVMWDVSGRLREGHAGTQHLKPALCQTWDWLCARNVNAHLLRGAGMQLACECSNAMEGKEAHANLQALHVLGRW